MSKKVISEPLAAEVNAKSIVNFKVNYFKLGRSLFIISKIYYMLYIPYKIKFRLCRPVVNHSR